MDLSTLSPQFLATTKQAVERMEICRKCPELRAVVYTCTECNCIMPAKVRLKEAWCPIGKWNSIE